MKIAGLIRKMKLFRTKINYMKSDRISRFTIRRAMQFLKHTFLTKICFSSANDNVIQFYMQI